MILFDFRYWSRSRLSQRRVMIVGVLAGARSTSVACLQRLPDAFALFTSGSGRMLQQWDA